MFCLIGSTWTSRIRLFAWRGGQHQLKSRPVHGCKWCETWKKFAGMPSCRHGRSVKRLEASAAITHSVCRGSGRYSYHSTHSSEQNNREWDRVTEGMRDAARFLLKHLLVRLGAPIWPLQACTMYDRFMRKVMPEPLQSQISVPTHDLAESGIGMVHRESPEEILHSIGEKRWVAGSTRHILPAAQYQRTIHYHSQR
jgi:hypothetical protein